MTCGVAILTFWLAVGRTRLASWPESSTRTSSAVLFERTLLKWKWKRNRNDYFCKSKREKKKKEKQRELLKYSDAKQLCLSYELLIIKFLHFILLVLLEMLWPQVMKQGSCWSSWTLTGTTRYGCTFALVCCLLLRYELQPTHPSWCGWAGSSIIIFSHLSQKGYLEQCPSIEGSPGYQHLFPFQNNATSNYSEHSLATFSTYLQQWKWVFETGFYICIYCTMIHPVSIMGFIYFQPSSYTVVCFTLVLSTFLLAWAFYFVNISNSEFIKK